MITFNKVPDNNKRFFAYLYTNGLLSSFLSNVVDESNTWSSPEELFVSNKKYLRFILSRAFDWASADEGYYFWDRVHSDLYELESKNGQ